MNRFYRTEYYISINGDTELNMYGCLSRENLHYGEIPDNEHIDFGNVLELKSFIGHYGNQFYNKRTLIGKRPFVEWNDGWGCSRRYYDDKFKSSRYGKVYTEVDLSNASVEYLMKNLCADDFAKWLKDNGISNCPIISK